MAVLSRAGVLAWRKRVTDLSCRLAEATQGELALNFDHSGKGRSVTVIQRAGNPERWAGRLGTYTLAEARKIVAEIESAAS